MNGQIVCLEETDVFSTSQELFCDILIGRGALSREVSDYVDLVGYAWISDLTLYKESIGSLRSLADTKFRPEYLIELSEDGNNWRTINNGGIPFRLYNIEPNGEAEIFIRNLRVSKDVMDNVITRTAQLELTWELYS